MCWANSESWRVKNSKIYLLGRNFGVAEGEKKKISVALDHLATGERMASGVGEEEVGWQARPRGAFKWFQFRERRHQQLQSTVNFESPLHSNSFTLIYAPLLLANYHVIRDT